MGTSFTTNIICPDGNPENIRVATKLGWTGKVFYISRDFWANGINEYREVLKVPGVYILAGREEDNSNYLQTIYIGVSENLFTRIEQHIPDPKKSFFQNIVCVVGGDGFHNTHFRWMESYLINEANQINRCLLETRNVPAKPRLPDADEYAVKNFLEVALPIFRLFEIKAFVPPKTISRKSIVQTTIDMVEQTKVGSNHITEPFEIGPLKFMLTSKINLEDGRNLTIAECLRCGFWVNEKFEKPWQDGKAFLPRPPQVKAAADYGFAMQNAKTMLVAPAHPPMKKLLSRSKYRDIEPKRYFRTLPDVAPAENLSGCPVRIRCGGRQRYALALPKEIFEAAGFHPP